VVYLYDERCLFTGDSLAWSFEEDDLVAYRDYCWYSWPAQTRSLRRLLDYRFEWVLAGHGGAKGLSSSEMHAPFAALVEGMEREWGLTPFKNSFCFFCGGGGPPPRSIRFCWPPVQAGWVVGSMSSVSLASGSPQVVRMR